MRTLLAAIADDRLGMHGSSRFRVRRGEIAVCGGPDRPESQDVGVVNNRVGARGKTVEGDPKSDMSRRTPH